MTQEQQIEVLIKQIDELQKQLEDVRIMNQFLLNRKPQKEQKDD